MLPDPVSISASSPNPALILAIVKSDGLGSERVDTGGNGYTVVINHSRNVKTGNRHYVQLAVTKDATNPYTALVQSQRCAVSLSVSRPAFGFTDADVVAAVKALTDFLADSEVTPAKLIQFQS